jgi:phosphoglycolate phosphatase-like HAD superfamily hydrolase
LKHSAKKLFVWDFHGTLEHGNDFAVHEITNLILEDQGYKRRMSIDEAFKLSGHRWYEYFSILMPKINPETCVHLQNLCISVSQKHPEIVAKHIKITPNALKVLESIDKSRHEQIVLSNTQPKSLDMFLRSVNIEHYFPPQHRLAADSHCQTRKTKKDWLNEFLTEKSFPGGLICIGDSLGDVELASCHPNGVGYLFSHPDRAHRCNQFPNRITDLTDILKEVTDDNR